jgi:hypothetical protein
MLLLKTISLSHLPTWAVQLCDENYSTADQAFIVELCYHAYLYICIYFYLVLFVHIYFSLVLNCVKVFCSLIFCLHGTNLMNMKPKLSQTQFF